MIEKDVFDIIEPNKDKIYSSLKAHQRKSKIDFVDSQVIDNIINAQEFKLKYNIDKAIITYDSLYLHFYIKLVEYLYFTTQNKDFGMDFFYKLDEDIRLTFIHRDIINDILEPFYKHTSKKSKSTKANILIEALSSINLIDNDIAYKPFELEPYQFTKSNIPEQNNAIWYRLEFDKRIHNYFTQIKSRNDNHTYTKLPANLYSNMANAVDNKKDLKLYYSFYVSLIKTNTNNVECIERDINDLILYLPSTLKRINKNNIYLKKPIDITLKNNFENISNITNNITNKNKLLLPKIIRVDIINNDSFSIEYNNNKKRLI